MAEMKTTGSDDEISGTQSVISEGTYGFETKPTFELLGQERNPLKDGLKMINNIREFASQQIDKLKGDPNETETAWFGCVQGGQGTLGADESADNFLGFGCGKPDPESLKNDNQVQTLPTEVNVTNGFLTPNPATKYAETSAQQSGHSPAIVSTVSKTEYHWVGIKTSRSESQNVVKSQGSMGRRRAKAKLHKHDPVTTKGVPGRSTDEERRQRLMLENEEPTVFERYAEFERVHAESLWLENLRSDSEPAYLAPVDVDANKHPSEPLIASGLRPESPIVIDAYEETTLENGKGSDVSETYGKRLANTGSGPQLDAIFDEEFRDVAGVDINTLMAEGGKRATTFPRRSDEPKECSVETRDQPVEKVHAGYRTLMGALESKQMPTMASSSATTEGDRYTKTSPLKTKYSDIKPRQAAPLKRGLRPRFRNQTGDNVVTE